jgi:hypothetical protein
MKVCVLTYHPARYRFKLHDLQSSDSILLCIIDQNGVSALFEASAEGYESVVKLLLDAKADVNHADDVRHSICRHFT